MTSQIFCMLRVSVRVRVKIRVRFRFRVKIREARESQFLVYRHFFFLS